MLIFVVYLLHLFDIEKLRQLALSPGNRLTPPCSACMSHDHADVTALVVGASQPSHVTCERCMEEQGEHLGMRLF